MYRPITFVCLLALIRLSSTQTVQTRLTCLSDGQCITDSGEEAVCGKIDESATANLPTVGGVGDEYVIRINLNEPLQEDLNQRTEQANRDPPKGTCPLSHTLQAHAQSSETLERQNSSLDSQIDLGPMTDTTTSTTVNDNDRNPFLGGVGCITPAFPKACQYCCFQTAVILGSSTQSFVINEADDDDDDKANKRQGEDDVCDDDVVRQLRSSSQEDCFRRASLGFRRTPTQRFFRECNRLSSQFCAPALRRCVDFR